MTDLAQAESSYIGGAYVEPETEPLPKITEVKSDRPRDLVERAVFVSVTIGRPSVSKSIKSDRISFESEVDVIELQNDANNGEIAQSVVDEAEKKARVDRKMISVNKKLIDCQEYKAIYSLDSAIKTYIKSRCTASLVRDGIFLLPLALCNEVDHRIAEYTTKRLELIERYGAVYDKRVEEGMKRLGPEGNRQDYPSWNAVKELFHFSWQYISLSAPTVLGNVNEKILEREQEKVAAQFRLAADAACQSLRVGMAEVVNTLADQLASDPATGNKKVLRKVSVEKMVDFLALFDAKNIADDAILAELASRAKNLLEGTSADSLRTDDHVRDEIAKGFAEIKASLAGLVVEAPSRAIMFDD